MVLHTCHLETLGEEIPANDDARAPQLPNTNIYAEFVMQRVTF
jgi:hypothetical protein